MTDDTAARPPRRRGRPPKSVAAPTTAAPASGAAPALAVEAEGPGADPTATPDPTASRRRPGRPVGSRTRLPGTRTATPRPARGAPALTAERVTAVDASRDVRLSPDGRVLAFTSELNGTRQLCVAPLRGGWPRAITSGATTVTDPRWSPDGRAIAFVRDESIWVVDVDGGREIGLAAHPAGSRAPRWSPDGRTISFISRRRGWDQVWLVDALVPRRGRPASNPRPPAPRAVTATGVDVEEATWSPDGARLAIAAQRSPDLLTSQVSILDIATGEDRVVAGDGSWAIGPRWLPDGSGILCSVEVDGWLQVVRVPADGPERAVLTAGQVEHADLFGNEGWVALPSPDGSRFVHIANRDGCADVVVSSLAGAGPMRRPRGRPPKTPRPAVVSGGSVVISPWPGVWRALAWLPDGSAVLAMGEGDRAPRDVWLLPVPSDLAAPGGADRPRRLTTALPATVDVSRFVDAEPVAFAARDGLSIHALLYRPADATGKRAGHRVPAVIHAHGGPNSQAWRDWQPLRQLIAQAGMALLSVDFRGSTGHGQAFRLANRGEWGNADVGDIVDAGQWAAEQPWCDGRLAVYGGSYGGYLVLCALTEEPAMWRAGIDLYGDSDIAESFRHGDRPGRLDLQRQMGHPDDPEAAPGFRRGSPVHRAERIEAPLLILHGRKDRRVVPLMTERIVEALEIEGKHHEVHWYDDEAHGWQRRDTQRDSFERVLAFLRRHLLEEPLTSPERAGPAAPSRT